jgi:hypothetical protein
MTRNKILQNYFGMAVSADNYRSWLTHPLPKADREEIEELLAVYTKKMALMEATCPWIIDVVAAAKGS